MAAVRELVADLHAHLAATGELPVESETARWLGEAEAVAADIVGDDVPDAAVDRRVGQLRELLAHVGDPDDPEVGAHVEAARERLDAIERELEP